MSDHGGNLSCLIVKLHIGPRSGNDKYGGDATELRSDRSLVGRCACFFALFDLLLGSTPNDCIMGLVRAGDVNGVNALVSAKVFTYFCSTP